MRLNGRLEIMAYLGRSWRNKAGWRQARERYGELIHCEPGNSHVWALSEELDAADKARCLTMTEMLASRAERGEAVAGAVGGYPHEHLKLVKRLFEPRARGRGKRP